jgi:hypothetical protein
MSLFREVGVRAENCETQEALVPRTNSLNGEWQRARTL